jgi:hypothetical protein
MTEPLSHPEHNRLCMKDNHLLHCPTVLHGHCTAAGTAAYRKHFLQQVTYGACIQGPCVYAGCSPCSHSSMSHFIALQCFTNTAPHVSSKHILVRLAPGAVAQPMRPLVRNQG